MTSYDEVYVTFISNCKTEDINLPQDNAKIYEVIKSAVRLYNNRLRSNIICDDETESMNQILNDDELITVAHYIRLSFLENQLIYFTTLWQPFSKDLGLKNYNIQAKSLELLIDLENIKINEIIRNTEVDFF